MSQPVIPIAATLPIPAVPVAPTAPMSAEEVAAIAGRMRLEARLPRIVVVGGVLGILCAVVTTWPFIASDDYLVNAMVRGGVIGWVTVLVPLALSGLLPLLAFYSFRLHAQSGPANFVQIEDNLRKIRAILAACMFTALGAIVGVLTDPEEIGDIGLAGLYALACAACGIIVGDVRKALGEFDTDEEKRRRRMARGFAVQLKSETLLQPAAAATPVPVMPLAQVAPPAAPPAAPIRLAAPVDLGTTRAERDLRTILHLLAAVGIAIYILRVPLLANLEDQWDWIRRQQQRPGSSDWGETLILLLRTLDMFLALCGVAWVTWGVIVLSFGARLRVAVLTFAFLTLGCLVLHSAMSFGVLAAEERYAAQYLQRGRDVALDMTMLFPRIADFVHATILCVLLTRPRVKDLFTQGSEAGEGS